MNKQNRIVYVYFDSKAEQHWTDIDIAKVLLKQLLSQSNNTPPDLETLYIRSIHNNPEPTLPDFIEILSMYALEFRVYALFDGIDECDDEHQKSILALFVHLGGFGCRLLISCRPHVYIPEQLGYTQTIEVSADESDLRNYFSVRLRQERHTSSLQAKCLELIKSTQGMYDPDFIISF